ncbi:MAG: 2-amino-4-hydroxy-6-hydroxymethyldihydropteridine diphosphokinase [Micrococcus sp.]|nr:2-amino-4-hydroxy-6-hydroxymethyldihydropteridine diphosphokinase [Micrococcus sp.]
MPTLGVAPAEPVDVVLALGANLGDPNATLDDAVAALSAHPGLSRVRASPRAVTCPVGGPTGQPDYVNLVVRAATTLSPWHLLGVAHLVEQEHHRRREIRWGPRTLDVDIIVYGDLRSDHPDLTLPHPRAAQRGFVLLPWLWLDPQAQLAGESVATLVEHADDAATVRRQEPQRLHLHRDLDGRGDRPSPTGGDPR